MALPIMPVMPGAPIQTPHLGLDALLGQMQPAAAPLGALPALPAVRQGISDLMPSPYAGGAPGGMMGSPVGTSGPLGTVTSGTTSVGPPPSPYNGPIPHSVSAWEHTFQNGRIPDNAMAPVSNGSGGTGFFMPTAAHAYDAMMQAAARDGVHLAFGGSYRPYDVQVSLAQQKGLYSQGGLAAVPGTSEHGWGLAADMNLAADPHMLGWLQSNAHRFGFYNIPREDWHWQFQGGYTPQPQAQPQHSPTPARRVGRPAQSKSPAPPAAAVRNRA